VFFLDYRQNIQAKNDLKKLKYRQPITRTIKVSCLSRFLHGLLHRLKICNGLAPGLAPLHVIEFLQLDYFQTSRQVTGAHAAPLAAPQICNTGLIRFYAQGCTATLIQRIKFVPGLQKHAPYLSCHRDKFRLKQISNRSVATPGNTTSLYCRAVSGQHAANR